MSRCIVDHSSPLFPCLHHTVPRPLLDTAGMERVEFCPQEFLHLVLDLHCLHHDATLCTDSRTRNGMAIGRVYTGSVSNPRTDLQCAVPCGISQEIHRPHGDTVGILHRPRVDLRRPATPAPPANKCANRDRFLLSSHVGRIPWPLRLELDLACCQW